MTSTTQFEKSKTIWANVARLPIPNTILAQRAAIEDLVRKLRDAQGERPQVAEWEWKLNELVYQVYGLTEDGTA